MAQQFGDFDFTNPFADFLEAEPRGLASAMESAAAFPTDFTQIGPEDIEAAKWKAWLAQPENMMSAVQAPTLMRTDPFKRDMMRSAFQRLYDIAASRDPAGGANVDIASLFGSLR